MKLILERLLFLYFPWIIKTRLFPRSSEDPLGSTRRGDGSAGPWPPLGLAGPCRSVVVAAAVATGNINTTIVP